MVLCSTYVFIVHVVMTQIRAGAFWLCDVKLGLGLTGHVNVIQFAERKGFEICIKFWKIVVTEAVYDIKEVFLLLLCMETHNGNKFQRRSYQLWMNFIEKIVSALKNCLDFNIHCAWVMRLCNLICNLLFGHVWKWLLGLDPGRLKISYDRPKFRMINVLGQ